MKNKIISLLLVCITCVCLIGCQTKQENDPGTVVATVTNDHFENDISEISYKMEEKPQLNEGYKVTNKASSCQELENQIDYINKLIN